MGAELNAQFHLGSECVPKHLHMLSPGNEIDMETNEVLALRWVRQIGSGDGVEGHRFLACGFPGGRFFLRLLRLASSRREDWV